VYSFSSILEELEEEEEGEEEEEEEGEEGEGEGEGEESDVDFENDPCEVYGGTSVLFPHSLSQKYMYQNV